MAPSLTREQILTAAVQIHLDEAYALREQRTELSKKLAANRQDLTNALILGNCSEEQAVEIMELYPERERASAAERVERLREQLAKAEEKAAKEAEDDMADDGTEPETANDAVGAAA